MISRRVSKLISTTRQIQISASYWSDKSDKKVSKFSRGIPLEVGDKSTLYDRLGYWDSPYKELNVDDSIRHGILIPQIPFEDIGIHTQTGRRPDNQDKVIVEKISNRHVLAALFDGHGNEMCAQFCKDNIGRNASRHTPVIWLAI